MVATDARRLLAAALCAAVAAVVLAACGGSGDSAQTKITDTLNAGLTTTDPAIICKKTLSSGLVTRVYGSEAKCISIETKDAKTSKPANAVGLSGIKVSGDSGTVFVEVKGGDQDGARGVMNVVKQGDNWRIDDLSTEFLRSEFQAGVTNDRKIPSALKACIASKVLALDDTAFRTLGYGAMGDQPATLDQLKGYVSDCATQLSSSGSSSNSGSTDSATASVLRTQFEKGIADSLRKDGISTSAIDCVKTKLRSGISDKQIISLIGKGSSNVPPEIASTTAGALAACNATK